jgi:hypothetical protein
MSMAEPDTVIIVVLTDGKENASETPHQRVRDQIQSRRESNGWEFLTIGANQDAALTANKMGMDTDNALDMAHSGDGARAAYEATSDRVSEARRHGSTGGFTESDRRAQSEDTALVNH